MEDLSGEVVPLPAEPFFPLNRCAWVRRHAAFAVLLIFLAGCAQPSASPSPKPVGAATSQPAGAMPLPLIWLRDGTTASGVPPRYFLTDWTGRRWGTLTMWGQIQPSPDGSRALVDGANIIDTNGTGLGTVQIPGLPDYAAAWADDNRHICAVGVPQVPGPAGALDSLWLLALGASPRKLAGFNGAGADFYVPICSIANNRAVIVTYARVHIPPPQGNPYEATTLVVAVDLATGRTIYTHDYTSALPATVFSVVISGDGRLRAEQDQLQPETTIKDLTTGQTVTTFPNAYVAAFSWDDRPVAIHFVSGNVDVTRVVDLASGQMIWQGNGSLGVFFRPGGSDFIVTLDDPAGDYDVLLVPATGSPRIIARQVFVNW